MKRCEKRGTAKKAAEQRRNALKGGDAAEGRAEEEDQGRLQEQVQFANNAGEEEGQASQTLEGA